MNKNITMHIVPHTHWDREWYYTLEEFRYRLLPLMDSLIASMENGAIEWFVLDGQTLMLRDYLELRPENRERLTALITGGRLLIGPWFSQPNTFMSCAEAQVQNLLAGQSDMKAWGGGMSDINYQPDQFGFHAQLPQIMAGFGMTLLVGARGMPKGSDTYFHWEGVDGTVVGVCALTQHYNNANGLSDRTEPVVFKIFGVPVEMPSLPSLVDNITKQRARSLSTHLLAMNGVDHMRPNPMLPDVIEKIRSMYPDIDARQSNFRHYIDKTEAELLKKPKTVRGELKDGRELLVLTGAQSSRMDVKMYNREMERLLIRRVEPLLTIMKALGEENLPYASYHQAWDLLLQNHAHDSLCAGNSDPSYREILTRYDKVSDICREICNELEQRLLRRISDYPEEGLLIINPSPVTRVGPVVIEVAVPAQRAFAEPHLMLGDEEISAYVTGARNDWLLRYIPFSGLVGQLHVSIFTMTINPGEIPPMGYKMLEVRGGKPHDRAVSGLVKSPRCIENESLCITIESDGSVSITDKLANQTYKGLNMFMDDGETGCCFIHSTPYRNTVSVSAGGNLTVDIAENNPLIGALEIRQSLSIPAGLAHDGIGRSDERVNLAIKSRVILRAGSHIVEFETVINNMAKDHRLRVAFPSDVDASEAYAGQPFDIVMRPVQPELVNHYGHGDHEALHGYHPMEGFCGIADGKRGFAIVADSLMEYEILPMRNTVCLTMLRCTDREHVGVLANGSKFKVPAAQLQGMRTYRYAVIPHTGGFEAALPLVEAFRNPTYAIQKDLLEDETMPDYKQPSQMLPNSGGYLLVNGDVTISRLKPAEDRNGTILRIFNPSSTPQCAKVCVLNGFILKSASLVKMDESGNESLVIRDNAVEVILERKKIATMRLHISHANGKTLG